MAHRLTEKELGLSEQALQLAPFAILVLDSFAVIAYANAKARELLVGAKNVDQGIDALVGQPAEAILAGIDISSLSSTPTRESVVVKGRRRTVDISAVKCGEGDARVTFLYLNDADRQRKRELLLEKEATTDELSGLANRRAFQRTMEASQHLPLSLAILDIDHFKLINDDHGHLAGDEAIRMAGGLLAQHFEHTAIVVSRMGGDEFSALFETSDSNAILKSLEDYRKLLSKTELKEHGGLQFSVSVGVAVSLKPQTGSRTLLTHADRQLYVAKDSGRNRLAHIVLP